MSSAKKPYHPFITGLKGYAILGVFLIHAAPELRTYSSFFNSLVEFGKYGVTAFFFLSAFTICLSLAHQNNFHFLPYIHRRLSRIIPLYFLILLLCFLFKAQISFGGYYKELFSLPAYDFKDLFFHLTFLNLFKSEYQNSLIGVEWVIPIEFAYYFFLPALFFSIKKSPVLLLFSLILGILLYFNPTLYFPVYLSRYTDGQWGIEKYWLIYSLGITTYFFIHEAKTLKLELKLGHNLIFLSLAGIAGGLYFLSQMGSKEKSILIILSFIIFYTKVLKQYFIRKFPSWSSLLENFDILAILTAFFYFIQLPYRAPEVFISFFLASLLLAFSHQSILRRWLFENRLIVFIGTISYPFFLTHTIAITMLRKFEFNWLITCSAAFLLSLISSYFLHLKVEKRFFAGK